MILDVETKEYNIGIREPFAYSTVPQHIANKTYCPIPFQYELGIILMKSHSATKANQNPTHM